MSTLLFDLPPTSRERLFAMSAAQRLGAYERGELSLAELNCWASLFPEEVPLINGELPWIVATLADLD
jgi:hypothetical protein